MSGEVAIVLAGGRGSRMKSSTPKQYLTLCGKPVLWYSLKTFEESHVSHVILVTDAPHIAYCREKIVEKYGFHKVSKIIPGGKERFDSVYAGLLAAEGAKFVYIHDGARPNLDGQLLKRLSAEVREYGAVTAAVPVKDTIKIADQAGMALKTPDRSRLWSVQTPQVFSYPLIREAYDRMMREDASHMNITDDTMVAEQYAGARVKMVMGSYANSKITTPEDLIIMEQLMKKVVRKAVDTDSE